MTSSEIWYNFFKFEPICNKCLYWVETDVNRHVFVWGV